MSASACPNCGTPLAVEVIASANRESRMQFSVSPASGEFLAASNVGGMIQNISSLLKAVGNGMKSPTEVLVERIETDEAGKITVHLIVARIDHPHGPRQRGERLKAQRDAEGRRD